MRILSRVFFGSALKRPLKVVFFRVLYPLFKLGLKGSERKGAPCFFFSFFGLTCGTVCSGADPVGPINWS